MLKLGLNQNMVEYHRSGCGKQIQGGKNPKIMFSNRKDRIPKDNQTPRLQRNMFDQL